VLPPCECGYIFVENWGGVGANKRQNCTLWILPLVCCMA